MNRKILLFVIVLKALFAIVWVSSGIWGLVPDEAQYWTWSRVLDWGYYSKPPGIAWQIWVGTTLFGQTELGVRFIAILIASLQAYGVYLLGKGCQLSDRRAAWSGVIMALTPMGMMGSLMATTDGGLILFWTYACAYLVSVQSPRGLYFGLLLAAGSLFKWPIYLLWFFAPWRIRGKELLVGIVVSLLGLLPSLYWNFHHDWATFRHVGSTVVAGSSGSGPNFFDFLGGQALFLSPLFFLLLIGALFAARKGPPPIKFCACVTGSIVATYAAMALTKKMQANWCLFAYPTAVVVLVWWAREFWLKVGLVVSLCLIAFLLNFQWIPWKWNPFRNQLGWWELTEVLDWEGVEQGDYFLFGDKYQMSSLLSFYGPGQPRAYFLNLQGSRLNQFSFWPSMAEEQIGKDGFFVLAENRPFIDPRPYLETLPKYFDKVTLRGLFPIYEENDEAVKTALVIFCEGYNGKTPETNKKNW